jgi:hypothetical protein
MTRTRPPAIPKGSVAMMPVLPQPTGICRIPDRSTRRSAPDGAVGLLLGLAQKEVRLDVGVRRREYRHLAAGGLGSAVLQPERFEVRLSVVAVLASGPVDSRQRAVAVPPPEAWAETPHVRRRLGDPHDLRSCARVRASEPQGAVAVVLDSLGYSCGDRGLAEPDAVGAEGDGCNCAAHGMRTDLSRGRVPRGCAVSVLRIAGGGRVRTARGLEGGGAGSGRRSRGGRDRALGGSARLPRRTCRCRLR